MNDQCLYLINSISCQKSSKGSISSIVSLTSVSCCNNIQYFSVIRFTLQLAKNISQRDKVLPNTNTLHSLSNNVCNFYSHLIFKTVTYTCMHICTKAVCPNNDLAYASLLQTVHPAAVAEVWQIEPTETSSWPAVECLVSVSVDQTS